MLIHQILAQVMEHAALGRGALWSALCGPHPFSAVDRSMFDRVVNHLVKTGILDELDGLLVFGEEGERVFGRKNFFDLYSVFETPSEVTVKTLDGRVVGTLDTEFVRKMEGSTLTFLLAGRVWQAVEVDLDRALIVAMPFTGGEAPRWHGAGGFLGREIAEEMRRILLTVETFRFVDESGRSEVERLRDERGPTLARDRCPITREKSRLRLHTYAGGRINATIAALLEQSGAVRVAGFGDLAVDLVATSGGFLGAKPAQSALRSLREVEARLTDGGLANLVSEKRRGRLAKFQPYLPHDLEGAYLAEELFDILGAANLAAEAEFPIV